MNTKIYRMENINIIHYSPGQFPETLFNHIREALSSHKKTVVLENKSNMHWFVACDQQQAIIGCAALFVKNSVARFKCDIVSEQYRNQGVYAKLFKARQEFAKNDLSLAKADAFAGPMSYNTFIRNGFKPVRQTNNQPTFYVTKTL